MRRTVSSFAAIAAVLAAVSLSSCLNDKPKDGEPTKAQAILKRVELRVGPTTVLAELAVTAAEHRTGLMFRDKLADGEGMLFVFDRDQRLSFWMKNTKLPLSVAYVDSSGVIREIHDMQPFSLATIGSESSLRFALEVPQGWFARANVSVGDRIDLAALRK